MVTVQVQGFAPVEFQKVSISPFLQPIEFSLNGSMTLWWIKRVILHSPPPSASSVNLLRVHSALLSRLLKKMLIRIGSSIDPWVLLLLHSLQLDFFPLIITNCSGSFHSNSLSAHPAHTSPALDIIPLDRWRTPSLYSKLLSPSLLWHHCLGVFWICIQHKEYTVHCSKAGEEKAEKTGCSATSYATHEDQSPWQPLHIDVLPPTCPLFEMKAVWGSRKGKKDLIPWFHSHCINYKCSQHVND